KPGTYFVEAVWRDFDGPIGSVEGQLPFMPLPKSGPCDLDSGPYAVRGKLDGRSLTFEVPILSGGCMQTAKRPDGTIECVKWLKDLVQGWNCCSLPDENCTQVVNVTSEKQPD